MCAEVAASVSKSSYQPFLLSHSCWISSLTGESQPKGSKSRATSDKTNLLVQVFGSGPRVTLKVKQSCTGLQSSPRALTVLVSAKERDVAVESAGSSAAWLLDHLSSFMPAASRMLMSCVRATCASSSVSPPTSASST